MRRADVWAAVIAMALPIAAQRGAIRNVSVSPSSAETGVPVQIRVTGDNPCGAVRIDYGDGTERITHPLTDVPATIRYVYKRPGTYQVRAEGMGNCDGEASTVVKIAQGPEPRRETRFLEMDENGDGVVTRTEWRGSSQAFRRHDLNADLVLSGDELRPSERSERRSERSERRSERPVGTTGAVLVLDPTLRWTNTGVWVREGELVTVDASGNVQLSANAADSGGPGGVESQRRAPSAPLPAHPAGALIARVEESEPVFVGEDRTFRAPASGQLYFGVNDDHLADNSGEFRVSVEVGRRDLNPEP